MCLSTTFKQRTMYSPLDFIAKLHTAVALVPPPDGSTPMNTYSQKDGSFLGDANISFTDESLNARCVLSAEIPIDSRKNKAGSSERSALIVSILVLDSHRGISDCLCVHCSGASLFKQLSQTKLIWMVSKTGLPSA